MTMRVEKRPGPDWQVFYMTLDGVRNVMTVFGAQTIEEATRDARRSFGPVEVEIMAVIRQNFELT